MSSLRRSLVRRYRFFSPQLFQRGLILLAILLLCDLIAAFCVPQIRAGLSLNAQAVKPPAALAPPAIVSMDNQQVLVSDDFKRTDQTYWGTAPGGMAWQADAQTARSFFISEDRGEVSATTGFLCGVVGPVVTNSEVLFVASINSYGQSDLGAILRWDSPNNFYTVVLGEQGLALLRVVDGMEIPLETVSLAPRPGASYTFLFRADGSQLSAMVWPTGQLAPADWQISLSDGSLSSGRAGIGAFIQTGNQVQVSEFKEVAL